MTARYDVIGAGYATRRRADPRIERQVRGALGDVVTVLNVGAGAGSYEPQDRSVVAVEPSGVQLAQRPKGGAPAVRAVAEALPFLDRSFDACLAVLTLHHWSDQDRGLAELRRVARKRVVVLTHDWRGMELPWLVRDYFPGIVASDLKRFRPVEEVAAALGGGRVESRPDSCRLCRWLPPRALATARGLPRCVRSRSDVGLPRALTARGRGRPRAAAH